MAVHSQGMAKATVHFLSFTFPVIVTDARYFRRLLPVLSLEFMCVVFYFLKILTSTIKNKRTAKLNFFLVQIKV